MTKRSLATAADDRIVADEHLARALSRGDAAAATALHHRVRPIVTVTLRRLVGDERDDEERLVQRVEAEIARTVAQRDRACTLDSWFAATTARVLFLRLYQEPASARSGPGALPPRSSPATPAERIRMHLHAMAALDAWLVVLHDVCGYDLAQVAQLTRLAVRRTSRRLGIARRDLYGRLRGDVQLVAELNTDFADRVRTRVVVGAVVSRRDTDELPSDAGADERGIRQMEELLRGVAGGRRRRHAAMVAALALAVMVAAAAACGARRHGGPQAAPFCRRSIADRP